MAATFVAPAARPSPIAPASRRALRLAAALAALGVAALCTACSSLNVEPWVKPYERERLADPIMQFGTEALPAKHLEHVYSVREGARGATGVQGGGCGCN